MTKVVDSFRFIGGVSKKLIQSWIKLESPREIPWTPLSKPLAESTVALVSTGGIALKTDPPFDQEGERKNPWWGDPSYRIIPRTARSEDIRVWHMHIDPSLGERDLNCLLPIERLEELAESGKVGRVAPSHYSIMGYLLEPQEMLEKSVPAIVAKLREEAVDVVVLVPAWPTCCWSVGLAQREIESAGFTTIVLTNIPDLTAAVSVPRLAAVEHPFGQIMGRPGDKDVQRAVLLDTLRAVEEMTVPGSIRHLPFEWSGSEKEAQAPPPVPPPIASYLKWHPWDLPKLFSRNVPRQP